MLPQNKFYKAVKTAQRVVDSIFTKDLENMNNVLDTAREVGIALSDYEPRIWGSNAIAIDNKVPDIIGQDIFNVSTPIYYTV